MTGPDGIILGFDPGGAGNFGWSVCVTKDGLLQPKPQTGLANDAQSAMDAVKKYLDGNTAPERLKVLAAGIDAPMYWGKTGNRVTDDFLRGELQKRNLKIRVLAVNSLWGAVLVQGVLLGKYLREVWKDLPITECHPNALRPLLRDSKQRKVIEMMDRVSEELEAKKSATQDKKEKDRLSHQRDATLAAISAWAMVHKPCGWQDLYRLECEKEGQPIQPFETPVAYWMPNPTSKAG